jgi:hypothetical protein
MSNEALNWARQQTGINSSTKFVLVAMADIIRESNQFFMSLETLCGYTNQDRKTVIKALKILCDLGLIADTGNRKGDTKKIVVYKLNFLNSTETGTIPNTEQFQFSPETVPNFPPNSTVFPSKQSQKRYSDTYINHDDPLNNHKDKDSPKSPKNKKTNSVKTALPNNFAVSEQVLTWYSEKGYSEDINQHLEHFINTCKANGYKYVDFDAALRNAISKDWAGLRKQPQGNSHQQPKTNSSPPRRKVI